MRCFDPGPCHIAVKGVWVVDGRHPCDVFSNHLDLAFLLEREGHRAHAHALDVVEVEATMALLKLFELALHVPLAQSSDGGCADVGVASTIRGVAGLAIVREDSLSVGRGVC